MGLRKKLAKAAAKLAHEISNDNEKCENEVHPRTSLGSIGSVGGGGGKRLTLKEKEELFFERETPLLTEICQNLGLRVPLVIWKRSDNGKGLCETYFANVEHLNEFYKQTRDLSLTRKDSVGNRASIIEDTRKDSNGRATVHIEGESPIRVVEEFETYENLVECYYEWYLQQNQAESEYDSSTLAVAQLEKEIANFRLNSMMDRQRRLTQAIGTTPTHYIDGVPNYNNGFVLNY